MRKAPTYATSPCLLGGPGSQITVPRGAWQVTAACSILIVLEGELELHQRGIDRADRLHTVATEIMRGALQMQPGSFERADRGHDLRVRLLDDAADRTGRFRRLRGGSERQGEDSGEQGYDDNARERTRHVASFRRLTSLAWEPSRVLGGPLVHPILRPRLRLRPVGDVLQAAPTIVDVAMEFAAPRVVVVRPVVRSPGLCHTSLPVGRTVRPHSPDSQSVCPAGGVQDKSARAIRIGDRSATTAGAQVVAQWAAMPRSDTNIQCDRDHHAPPRDVPPRLLQPAPRRQGAPPRG